MDTTNHSLSDIMAMKDEELNELNKKLARRFVKRIFLTIAVTSAAVLAVGFLADKLDSDEEETEAFA